MYRKQDDTSSCRRCHFRAGVCLKWKGGLFERMKLVQKDRGFFKPVDFHAGRLEIHRSFRHT